MTAENNDSGNTECSAPIDREHLAKYTLGDKAVEQEVLELFATQASQYLDRLKNADTQKSWREAAHTIKGSARGVGAWKVGDQAEALEKLDEEALKVKKDAEIQILETNIEEVLVYIRENQG